MTDWQRSLSFATLCWLFFCLARSSSAQTACAGPPPIRGTAKGNIFTEQQEMDLGDAMQQQLEHNLSVVHDDQLNSYLNQIAQRLLAQMPPTQMKFHVVLVNLPIVNAFTMVGGRIYVTRKLVVFARSEDELAGVLGHEIGHALTHQPAAGMSVLFRQVLGVTQVGDRTDIFLKYNQILENIRRKNLHVNLEEDRQNEIVADSYGLYAMMRAGYSSQAMASFWDRRAQTQGKTGNWLTDLFGATSPNEQRLRQMRLYNPAMPAGCIASRPSQANSSFQAWQQSVIAYTTFTGTGSLPGLLWKRQLSPPLESEINNVKFSPDGKYLLAQDDFSVYVLSREPLKSIFHIPVDDVEPAAFTPDSQSVLIWTKALHVEKWSVASQTRTEVHEVVTPESCLQSDVSPDGSVAACIETADVDNSLRFNLSLLDTGTNASIVVKQNFYQMTASDLFQFLFLALLQRRSGFFYMDFSPDGRYFAISRGNEELAWDLHTRSPVKLAPPVKKVMSGGFAFDGPDRVVGVNAFDPRKSGSAQFPSGPADAPIAFYQQALSAPAHGDGILVRPAGDNAVALVDLKTSKGILTSKISALDVYDNIYARPQPDGTVGMFDLGTRQLITSTPLLGHWIGHLRTADISSDLKWFAGSGATRGAIWNLATGDRVFHVRGFTACGFSSQDNLYAGFSPYLKEKGSIGILNPISNTIQSGVKLDENVQVGQLGMVLLYFRREKGKWNGPLDFEVHDLATGATLWTKRFSHVVPQVLGSPSDGEMTLILPLDSDEAREEEKQNAALLAEAKAVSSKETARLIQVVNAPDGKLRAEFVVDTGKGSFTVRQALPAGKWVVVADNENRALVYSLDGKLTGRLFGTDPTVSGSSGALALESQTGTVAVYDLATLTEREELTFGMPLAFYQFVDNGSKLFAVTADQTAYLFSLEQPRGN